MTHTANEAFGQARQGSVAAIIQVLNERLADMGIRTRAVVDDGMLQLLCEAQTPSQLEQDKVVERVRHELEEISPHRVRRVKINSRIVKEGQLLWLEEISRDPENSLLWAEVITLKQPFFIQRWIRDRNLQASGPILQDITHPSSEKGSLSSKLIAGSGLCLLILGIGWLFREDLSQIKEVANSTSPETLTSNTLESEINALDTPPAETNRSEVIAGDRTANTTPTARPPATPPATSRNNNAQTGSNSSPTSAEITSSNGNTTAGSNTGTITDAFSEAIRVAEQAGVDGQTATTSAEWLDLAARWQRASDLMGTVPSGSEQYAIAQDRFKSYRDNSEAALKQAEAAQ